MRQNAKTRKKTAKNTTPEKISVKVTFTISLPSLQKTVKEKKTKNKAEKTPVIETVVNIVKRSRKPVTVDDIEKKTEFDKRQIRNAVYVAKKEGKIKNVSRGVYTKV